MRVPGAAVIGLVALGCATVPPGSPGDGEVRVGALRLPETVRAGESYSVTFEGVTLSDPSNEVQASLAVRAPEPGRTPRGSTPGGGS